MTRAEERDANGRADMTERQPPTIGLTGAIGCGKSTIAGWLSEAGGAIVDADRLAREVTSPGEPAVTRIAERFGPGIVGADGSLDRRALGRIVFSDPAALLDLEAITHPWIRPRLIEAVRDARAAGAPFVVVEAIKLAEAGYAAECDEVWLVDCSEEAQRRRLAARGFDPDDIDRRLTAQGGALAARLMELLAGQRVRRFSTDAPAAETRREVRRALAEVLDQRRRGSA